VARAVPDLPSRPRLDGGALRLVARPAIDNHLFATLAVYYHRHVVICGRSMFARIS